MNDLKMLTREDVAEVLHVHVNTVSMLREVGITRGIKIGKNYMFPRNTIVAFETNYLGLDCSNKLKATESKKIVDQRQINSSKGITI